MSNADTKPVELSDEQIDVLIGALGAFIVEHETWVKNFNPEKMPGEAKEAFFAILSEKMTATLLLEQFCTMLGWSEEQITEYQNVIEREVYGGQK